ncbi:hypothetical protein A3K87_16065 [Variovorax paradoxus]|uniref:Uncharacterized protein n=1 Tax=Variovorax paradoxus TaxID=34073 RepID=A0AA91DNC9_VARPD|nr:hypothetical protein A3K87_16065 [Variovorax paradoxus]
MVVCVTIAVTPMTAVHEDMHQRTRQKKQERQGAEEVGAVFAQEEVRRDGAHDDQADGITRAPER